MTEIVTKESFAVIAVKIRSASMRPFVGILWPLVRVYVTCRSGGTQLRAAQGPAVHAGQPDVPPLADGGQEVRTDVPELDRGAALREGDPPGRRQHAGRLLLLLLLLLFFFISPPAQSRRQKN